MNFKNWLLNEADGSYGWFKDHWEKLTLGDWATISALITKAYIDVDQSPYHPALKKAISTLVKQFPETANLKITFDGYSPGTVMDYLHHTEFHQKKDLLPKHVYTGTSYGHWEDIKEDGLKPRSETGKEPVFGAHVSSASPANPNYIYLSATLGNAVKFASRDARRLTDTPEVILQIDTNGMDRNKLRPDEDSKATTWEKSFQVMGTIAYEGNIAPKYIKIVKAFNSKTNQWENPGEWLEPQDWLAQQMLHKKDYKQIPNSTASFKWHKLK